MVVSLLSNLETILVAITSIVKGVPKEIDSRNTGFYPTILSESVYSMSKFVLV